MIWSDEWSIAATDWHADQEFNTTLPPPEPTLPTGVTFRCVRWATLAVSASVVREWVDLVGTEWAASELSARLADAWIPLLRDGEGRLVGTAVFRPNLGGAAKHWLLETLRVARDQRGQGWGRLLMSAGRRWLWCQTGGPFVLAFVWELSAPGLVAAWWRGWMRAAVAVQRGWMFAVDGSGCGFCPAAVAIDRPRHVMPSFIQTTDGAWAVVNDADGGWGHVCVWRGDVDWSAVAKIGGWRRLWARADVAPSAEWRWSGEFVVVAALNGRPALEWTSAEIA